MQRRHFLGAAAACAALPASSSLFGAAASYDLVIRGGRVVDPSQQLDTIADIALLDGKVAAIDANIPADVRQSDSVCGHNDRVQSCGPQIAKAQPRRRHTASAEDFARRSTRK